MANGDGGAVFTLSLRGTPEHVIQILINSSQEGNIDFMSDLINDDTLIFTKETVTNCIFTNNMAKVDAGTERAARETQLLNA